MENNSENLQFLICSQCAGSGLINRKKCKTCQGKGVIAYLDGYILYWGEKINSRFLVLYKLERLIINGVFIILFILALLGILSLGYAIYLDNFINFLRLEFWLEKKTLLLYFWLSVLTDLYLIYYLALAKAAKQKVLVREYKSAEDKNVIAPPKLDWQTFRKLGKTTDVAKAFGEEALLVVEQAFNIAKKYKAQEVGPVHYLIAALVASKNVQNMFARLGVNFDDFAGKIGRVAARYPQSEREPIFNQNSAQILLKAYRNAHNNRQEQVSTSDIR